MKSESKKGYHSDQPLEVLADVGQSDWDDDWDEYIEFAPNSQKFVGDFIFQLPEDVTPDEINSLSLESNYLGETSNSQRWMFRIRDFANKRWVFLGDNSEAEDWQWESMWFQTPANYPDFINANGEIKIRYQSNNSVDISNLDYLAIELSVEDTDPPEPPTDPYWWQPSPSDNLTWQWQLQGNIDHSYDVDVYDVDLFDVSAEEITQLKAEGRTVICYFSAGTYEGWRPDWQQHFSFITNDSYSGDEPPFTGNMAEWDERWLDIRRIDLLAPIMTARLDMAKNKGCDAVEPDNMDAWTNPSEVNLNPALSGNDQLTYNKWLAQQAHERGLSIGLKNDVDQLAELVDHFDWALNEQCFQYNECDNYSVFTNAGKAVFGVEYQGDISNICEQARTMDLFWMKKNLSLNAWRQGCEDY